MPRPKKTVTEAQHRQRISAPGLKRVGGRIFEEFLPELRFPQGIRIFDEMRKNSGAIGGLLRAIEASFRSVKWITLPADESPRAIRYAAFHEECRRDMKSSWNAMVTDAVTFLPFGFAPMEVWFKYRNGRKGNPPSKYNDGFVGFADIGLIGQDSILEWAYDQEDVNKLIGLWQMAPPTYVRTLVPREKFLLFRTKAERDNPEGESILRSAYYDYYSLMRLENIESISLERTGAGIPVVHLPKGASTREQAGDDSDEAAAEAIVRQVRIDEQGGVVEPDGWVFRLERPNGRVDPELFDLPIRRHRSGMLMSVLSVFLELGTSRVGSFALAEQGQDFFRAAFEGYVTAFEEPYNDEAIPLLFELNGMVDTNLLPRLTHATLAGENVTAIIDAVKKLVETGFLDPNDKMISAYIKDLLHLPRGDSVKELEAPKDAEEPEPDTLEGEVVPPEEDDEDEEEEVPVA